MPGRPRLTRQTGDTRRPWRALRTGRATLAPQFGRIHHTLPAQLPHLLAQLFGTRHSAVGLLFGAVGAVAELGGPPPERGSDHTCRHSHHDQPPPLPRTHPLV